MHPAVLIVPLDGSELAERAAPVAGNLAARFDVPVVLVTVNWRERRETAQQYLDRAAATVPAVSVETIVLDEPGVASAITSLARDRDHSMICMTTHGRGGLRWAVVGSVAEEVVRISHEPVLLVGRRCDRAWPGERDQIVLCHDGSDATAGLVDPAAALAVAFGDELWIATVIHPLDVEDAERPAPLFVELEAQVAAAGLEPHALLLRSSYPAGALADLAEELPVSMFAMATHSREGISRVLVGSVTMGVLNTAACPVLTVHRPPRRSGGVKLDTGTR